MRFLSWNVQWCRGMDGRVDPGRIAADVRRLADPDVACFQEIAENYVELEGSRGESQTAVLARELPGYELVDGYGVDVRSATGGRMRFGNLIVSRLPVQRVLRHSLPWPADPEFPSMPRAAVEAVIETRLGPIRFLTTHLEYYSARQRAAQIERLRELHAEACAHALQPPLYPDKKGPFVPLARPSATIMCGDFNMLPDDPSLARLVAPFDDGTPRLLDAWRCAHPGTPHAPTFRLYDPEPETPPYCCDYVFVSDELAPSIATVRVDALTQASDHQPVIVEFRD